MDLKPASILDSQDPASKAISHVSKTGLVAVVMKGGKYFGLIDDRSIRRLQDASRTKCETLAHHAPHIEADYTLPQICGAFFSGRWKALPVFDNGKISGLLTRSDVLGSILSSSILKGRHVSEVMSSPAVAIEYSATLANAKADMKKHNVRRLVVTKNGYVEGILTSFDMAHPKLILSGEKKPILGEKENPELFPVSSYMRKTVHAVSPNASLSEAAHLMVKEGISALVVEDSGRPVGVLTARDLFETALKSAEEAAQKVFVSGLEGEDRLSLDGIIDAGKSAISKIEKSRPVESLSIHVKKYGNKYSARSRLIAGRLFTASGSDWSLSAVIKTTLSELKRQLEKGKQSKMHMKKQPIEEEV